MKNFIPDMNDRELDDLFRKAAEEYASSRPGTDVPARQEEVWKNLRQKLDAPGERHRKPIWWIFPVVLLSGILGFLIWQHFSIKTDKEVEQPIVISKARKNSKGSTSQGIISTKKNDQIKEIKPARSTGLTETTKASSRSRLPSRTTIDPFTLHLAPRDISEGAISINNYKFNTQLLPLKKMPIQLPGIVQNEHEIRLSKEPPTHFESKLHFSKKAPSIEMETAPKTEKKPAAPKIAHWNLGITLGPDWSGISGSRWKTGVGGGLKITYRLNRKWAFSTGLLLEKKLYNARPGNYNPPDSGWLRYDVKRINASCMVWDIPLNVEYTLWGHKGNRIFLSTGISSFWMHEEEYTYHYKTSSGSWKEWTKEMYNQNHHIFSILNFSAGYEKSWEHFSLQVSPYVKAPLKGIGYGRVKLYSTGVHFTLQYGLK